MKIYRLAQSNIEISLDNYIQSIQLRLEEIADYNVAHQRHLQQFEFDLEKNMKVLSDINYPNVDSLRNALQSKNHDSIHTELMNIFNWYKENRETVRWDVFRGVINDIQDYDEQIGEYAVKWTDETVQQQLRELTQQTSVNMQKISDLVGRAIAAIPVWNNSPIKINALSSDKDNSIDAEDSATIEVLGGGSWGGEASFAFFQFEGKFEIDDVLEAGDDDFFSNDSTQADYFNLIRALRNPSSFSKPKVITLYTARPKKDRKLYLDAKQVPSNIFLTTSFDFAEGFAMEYGGEKDIWKVRIKDSYLTMTMDASDQKQYQVTGGSFVPVESMELLS